MNKLIIFAAATLLGASFATFAAHAESSDGVELRAAFERAFATDTGNAGHLCTTAPETRWLSLTELQVKIETLGYKIREARLKKSCGELYAVDKGGRHVKLYVNPTNARIVGRQ